MEVPAPVMRRVLYDFPKLWMGPGPSNCSPRVLQSLSQPILEPMSPEAFKLMDEIKDGLKHLFQTKNELTLAISSSDIGGIETIMCNLLEPGDKVLLAVNGFWGNMAANIAKKFDVTVYIVEIPHGETFSSGMLEKAIARYIPKLLYVVHGGSSTGAIQPVDNLGEICHRYDCLLVVDAVASLGGVEFYTDKWEIDVVYAESHKAVGAPQGLSLMTFSHRAQNVVFHRKTPVRVFYWDLSQLGDYWNCFGRPRIYHHVVSCTLLYGLREALAIIVEDGLENVILRHQDCAQHLCEGLEKLNLKPYIQDPNKRLYTVTAIKIPKSVQLQKFIDYAMNEYNVEIRSGLGNTAVPVLRVGLMGYNATLKNVNFLLKIFKEVLQQVKFDGV